MRDLVSHAHLVELVHHGLGAADHLLGGRGLGGLGAELGGLLLERGRLLLCVRALAAATRLVGGARVEVLLPAHVVGVDLPAHGVEKPHLVHHRLEQLHIVGDDDEPALVLLQELAQPRDRVGVEVVGGLVEQQRGLRLAGAVGGGEEDPGQLHAAALTARERAEVLREDPVLEAQAAADARGLALGLVPAAGGELVLEPAVTAHGLVHRGVVGGVDHLLLGRGHIGHENVEPAGGENAGPGQLVHVALARVLRQVAQLPAARDLPGVWLTLAGEDPHRRRLTRAVPSHQADPVAGLDPQRGPVHVEQGAHAGAHLQVVDGDHVRGYLAVAFGKHSAARPLTGTGRPATLPAARVSRRVR